VSGFVKIYGSMLDSSIWGEPANVRLLWITMLAMADAEGEVMAAVPGLARRANLSIPETVDALRVLTEPDAFDRSGVDEGRRIRSIPGGWLLVNYQAYRELRTEKQINDADRKQRSRERRKSPDVAGDGQVTPSCDMSQMSHEVSASASAFGSSEGKVQKGEVIELVYAFIDEHNFGPFRDSVLGLLKIQRAPLAVLSTLRMHLQGEMQHELCAPLELGRACQDYLGASPERWSARYFAGFVRTAKNATANERAKAAEEIGRAEKRAEEWLVNEAEEVVKRRIRGFPSTNPTRHAELYAEAERAFPEAQHPRGRSFLIMGRLHELIEQEVRRAQA
jgi:hypothetical protein